jgi:Xaa-Pro aminopeptidase
MKKKTPPLILIQSSKTAADLRVLCGIQLPETAVLIKKFHSSTLIVSNMEYSRIRRNAKRGITVTHPEKIGSSWKKGPSDWISKGVFGKRLRVTPDFPFALAEQLKKKGFGLAIGKEPVCPRREIKTADEAKAVQQSQRAAVAAIKSAVAQIASAKIGRDQFLRIGKTILTSEAVRATIGHTLLDHDCIAEETIVSCGSASADPHERGEGPLRAGEPIVIDIFPRSGKTGYWGDITRTVCRGPAPAALKKQYNAVKAAQAAALKEVKSGAWTDDVHASAAAELDRRGFQTETIDDTPQGFIHGTGHGVGLEIHEAPRVSSGNHQKLRAGHIITIEPGLYYPDIGGVRIEDTILVTKEGYKMLAPCPKKLEV